MSKASVPEKDLTAELKILQQRISELEMAQKDYREREINLITEQEKYTSIFINSSYGILYTNGDGQILDVNPAMINIAGRKKKELIGRNLFQLIQALLEADEQKRVKDLANKFYQGSSIPPIQVKYNNRILEFVGQSQQKTLGFTFFVHDITSQKIAETTLREERDRLQQYLDIAGVIFIIIDIQGKIELINQKGCRILGYDYQEIIGKNWFDNFIVKEQQSQVKFIFQQIISGNVKPVEYYENAILTKNGTQRLIAWHNTLLKDVHGQILGSLSSGEDITEQRIAEEASRENETKYRRLHETMMDAFASVDLEGRICEYNRSFQLMLGYSVGELYKLTYKDITPVKWHNMEARIIEEEVMHRGYSNVYEKEYRRKDGTIFPVELRSYLIRDRNSKPKGIWAIVNDITERKQAENESKAHIQFLESLERIDRSLHTTTDLNNMLQDVLEVVLSIFNCHRSWLIFPCDPKAPKWGVQTQCTVPEYPGKIQAGEEIVMAPPMANFMKAVLSVNKPIKFGPGTEFHAPVDDSNALESVSQLATAIYPAVGKPWLLGLHHCSGPRDWNRQEELLFQEIGRRIGSSLTIYLTFRSLHESETRFRSVIEYSAVGMLLLDKDHFIQENNKAVCDILGYSQEELIGKNIKDITFCDDINLSMNNLARIWLGEVNNYQLVKRYIHKNGNLVWCEITVSSIYDVDGKMVYAMGQLQNISERKRAEEEIKKLAKFPSENPYPVFRIDKNGIILYANNSSKPLLKEWKSKMGSSLPKDLYKVVREIEGTGTRKEIEVTAEGKSYSLTFASILNETYTNIYGIDITQRNLAIEALKASEHLLQESQKIARIGHYTFNAITGDWTSSAALDDIFGINDTFSKNVQGWTQIMHPDWRDEMLNYLSKEVVLDHHDFDREYKIIRVKDQQERWVHGLGRLELDSRGKTQFMIGTIQDITERKIAELQVQKDLQEKSLLLKEIHHRVKNNLQIICSLLTLQASKMNNEEAKIASEISKNRIYSMALVHEQLYQSNDFSSIRIKNFITNLVQELGNVYQIYPKIKINTQVSDITLGIDYAIPCGLILNELITNAIKHAFPQNSSGIINIQFKKQKNSSYILKIRDNGVGLPNSFNMEEADSLGLRMVSLLVEQIEGVIKTESNNGTSIVIHFRE